MGKFTAVVHVLLLVVVIGEPQCTANGIDTCVCNIVDACDEHGKARANWNDFLPKNVEQFGFPKGGHRNLAYLCEGDTVAIRYDCNSRIPLYAATKVTGDQLSKRSIPRPDIKFRPSDERNQLGINFQQRDVDYENSKGRELCFKTYTKYIIEDEWLYLNGSSESPTISNTDCRKGLGTTINKGHLIASQYGFAVPERMFATFTYTNVVPQFGSFNGGAWRVTETWLIKWGVNYCAVEGARHVEMFIIVGAIPSTNFGHATRYFGKEGFSNYEDPANYPVNVPRYMWTAACCKYDLNGVWKYHSTAFYRQNHPGKQPCDRTNVAELSQVHSWAKALQGNVINLGLFPQTPQCEDTNNYIPLR